MKLFSLILVAILLNISHAKGSPSFHPNAVKDTVLEKAKRLHVCYLRVSMAKKQEDIEFYQRRFFYEFPNDFKLFNKLYGTTNGKPGLLAEVAEVHILDVFNVTTCISDDIYFRKVIGLAVDGVYDINAVNYFQTGVKTIMLKNAELVVKILSGYPPKKIYGFWHFYFDGLYPDREIANFVKEATSENQNMYNLMTQAHAAVIRERADDDYLNPVGEK